MSTVSGCVGHEQPIGSSLLGNARGHSEEDNIEASFTGPHYRMTFADRADSSPGLHFSPILAMEERFNGIGTTPSSMNNPVPWSMIDSQAKTELAELAETGFISYDTFMKWTKPQQLDPYADGSVEMEALLRQLPPSMLRPFGIDAEDRAQPCAIDPSPFSNLPDDPTELEYALPSEDPLHSSGNFQLFFDEAWEASQQKEELRYGFRVEDYGREIADEYRPGCTPWEARTRCERSRKEIELAWITDTPETPEQVGDTQAVDTGGAWARPR